MLSPIDAKRKSDAAARKLQKQEGDAKRRALAIERREIAKSLRKNVPFAKQAIGKKMAMAIRAGQRSIEYTFGADPTGSATCGRIEQWLREKGYTFTSHFEKGDDNMGDFNAPCNVHWEHHRLNITW